MTSSTTRDILSGAIEVVNSEQRQSWERDAFVSLVSQLAHCPAAPAPLPALSPAPRFARCGTSTVAVPARSTATGRPKQLSLFPPTPPLSPLDSPDSPASVLARARPQSLPLPLATCLMLNRSHSISAPGLEVATAYAERYNVPRESILLIGVAQVLRAYYMGLERRGPDGKAKVFGLTGALEVCTVAYCHCHDYSLANGLAGVSVEEEEEEQCVCGHGYENHERWRWEPPAKPGSLAERVSPSCQAKRDCSKDYKLGKRHAQHNSFAQTADDSFLFETDEEEKLCRPQAKGSPHQNDPSHISRFLHLPSSTIPQSLLPTAPSPGVYQLLKRFCYWSPWTYSGLNHPSSIGQAKVDLGEIRTCQQCNCADFYLCERWLRSHNRHVSRESLRSLVRRQSLVMSDNTSQNEGGGGGGGHSRRESRDNSNCGTTPLANTPVPGGRSISRLGNRQLQALHLQDDRGLTARASHRPISRRNSTRSFQSTTTSLVSLQRGSEEYPPAKCACGHAASSHTAPPPVADLSWVLVEWAYTALARLGAGNVVDAHLAWPLCEDALLPEDRGGMVISEGSTVGRRTPSPSQQQ